MQLIYKGKDITSQIDIDSIVLDDDCGDTLDSISVVIADAESLWLTFNPQQHDEIEVKHNGYSTGVMYVDSITPKNGTMIISALPIKSAMRSKKTGAWEQTTLQVILQQKASENDLIYQNFAVSSNSIKRVDQQGVSDLLFLKQQCDCHKYKAKIHNKKLVIYSEVEFEQKATVKTFSPHSIRNPKFRQDSNNLWHKLVLSYNNLTVAVIDNNAQGCVTEQKSSIPFYSIADGEIYANGLMYNNNKNRVIGSFSADLDLSIAAGNTIAMSDMGMFDGIYFITHITHQLIEGITSLSVRRVGDA